MHACMQADLEDAAAFAAPISGCRYVIHTASPVIMNPPKGKAGLTILPSVLSSGMALACLAIGKGRAPFLHGAFPVCRRRSTCCGQL